MLIGCFFQAAILGAHVIFGGDPYLNSTTVLFDTSQIPSTIVWCLKIITAQDYQINAIAVLLETLSTIKALPTLCNSTWAWHTIQQSAPLCDALVSQSCPSCYFYTLHQQQCFNQYRVHIALSGYIILLSSYFPDGNFVITHQVMCLTHLLISIITFVRILCIDPFTVIGSIWHQTI